MGRDWFIITSFLVLQDSSREVLIACGQFGLHEMTAAPWGISVLCQLCWNPRWLHVDDSEQRLVSCWMWVSLPNSYWSKGQKLEMKVRLCSAFANHWMSVGLSEELGKQFSGPHLLQKKIQTTFLMSSRLRGQEVCLSWISAVFSEWVSYRSENDFISYITLRHKIKSFRMKITFIQNFEGNVSLFSSSVV